MNLIKGGVTIIVPVFNEEDSIADSLLKTYKTLKSKFIDFELIVVNDGSTDNSSLIIQSCPFFSTVTYLNHIENQGFGAAIRTGIRYSQKEYIICIPVDSPLTLESLNLFLANMLDNDILLSYRDKRRGYSLVMKMNSYLYKKIISFFFNLNYKDYNWIHMYRTDIFEKISIESNGIFMLAEVIIKAERLGYQIGEFEIHHLQRLKGKPSATKINVIFNTLVEMMKCYFK